MITTDTKLSDLNLPYMDRVLAERFLLPPESLKRFQMPVPNTVGELMDASGMPEKDVVDILVNCQALNHLVWLTGDLSSYVDIDDVWICDMRPDVDYDSEALHPDARIFHLGNPASQLELMRHLSKVIVLRETPAHAWSAAMALRGMGVPAFVIRQP